MLLEGILVQRVGFILDRAKVIVRRTDVGLISADTSACTPITYENPTLLFAQQQQKLHTNMTKCQSFIWCLIWPTYRRVDHVVQLSLNKHVLLIHIVLFGAELDFSIQLYQCHCPTPTT